MAVREIVWVASSKKDVEAFPEDARDEVIFALDQARRGEKHESAKPLRGFGGAGVLEIRTDDDGDTYRTVYTVTLPDAIYVLHAFQKKSTKGIATPQRELELVRKRLKRAREISQVRGSSHEGRR